MLALAGAAGCFGDKTKFRSTGDSTQKPAAMAGRDMGGMTEPKIPAGADYTAADVRFMSGMIHHHAQAVKMAALATSHRASARVALFCEKVDVSQRDEIKMMQAWLREREQTVADVNDPHPMVMPGMLTGEQFSQLVKAEGAAFDKLFLTFMIQHHQGALKMVADLFASPGAGRASEVFRFASDVDADQRAEIDRMQQMLQAGHGP